MDVRADLPFTTCCGDGLAVGVASFRLCLMTTSALRGMWSMRSTYPCTSCIGAPACTVLIDAG